jgi:hypothetical protein
MVQHVHEKHASVAKSPSSTSVLSQDKSPRGLSRSIYTIILITLTICLTIFLLRPSSPTKLHHSDPYPYESPAITEDEPETENTCIVDPENPQFCIPYNPVQRYTLDYGGTACWQNEGVWIAHLSLVEMNHLGIDRFHDTPRSMNQTEEDEFCARLRTYGASFWSLPPEWRDGYVSCQDLNMCADPAIKVDYRVAFTPEGGMWVLDISSSGGEGHPPEFWLASHAITMEERCNVLKELGAKFCESLEACPETATFLKDTAELLRWPVGEIRAAFT